MAKFSVLTTNVCNIIFLLACVSGVFSTCRPPGDFEDLSVCTAASRTGRSFYIDVQGAPHDATAECRCSVEVSQSAKNVEVTYNYQGPTSPCESGFHFNVSNVSLTCNMTSFYVNDLAEIQFIKETTEQIDYACLIIYVDRNIQDNNTDASATVSCYEDRLISTSGATISVTDGVTMSTVSSATEIEEKFNMIIVLAIVAGIGALLLIIVVVTVCVYYCRSTHSTATYDVKRKQLDSSSSTDTDLTENAFYNVALVNSPTFYKHK